jgi:nucleotide-binding universal stress UspA family protein
MKILHPTDFSETADAALAQAERLGKALGGELVLLHVVDLVIGADLSGGDLSRVYDAVDDVARQEMAKRVAGSTAAGVPARGDVRLGGTAEQILEFAQQEQPDLIVIGTRGRRGLARLLLGSVAERVVRAAACPVMTVHGPQAAGAAGSAA